MCKNPSECSKPGFNGFPHLLTWQTGHFLQYLDWRECCKAEDMAESPGNLQDVGTIVSERTKVSFRQM